MADDGTTTPGGPPAPGWWMASDGRWYPPEAVDPGPEPDPDSPKADRNPLVLIGVGLVALIVLGLGISQVTGGDEERALTMDEVLELGEDLDLPVRSSDRSTTTTRPAADGDRLDDLLSGGVRTSVDDRMVLPFEINTTDGGQCLGGPGSVEVAFGDAELVRSVDDSRTISSEGNGTDYLYPQRDDEVWLIIDVDEVVIDGPDLCHYRPELPADGIVVVADDGTESESRYTIFEDRMYLVFVVDADVEELTLEVRPGSDVPDELARDAVYDFGDADGEIPIDFSASGRGR